MSAIDLVERVEQLLVDAYKRGFDEGAVSAIEEGTETPHKDTKNEGSGVFRQEAERQASGIADTITRLQAALEWYAEQAEGCRKIGSIGDHARKVLNDDGGKVAREALSSVGGE